MIKGTPSHRRRQLAQADSFLQPHPEREKDLRRVSQMEVHVQQCDGGPHHRRTTRGLRRLQEVLLALPRHGLQLVQVGAAPRALRPRSVSTPAKPRASARRIAEAHRSPGGRRPLPEEEGRAVLQALVDVFRPASWPVESGRPARCTIVATLPKLTVRLKACYEPFVCPSTGIRQVRGRPLQTACFPRVEGAPLPVPSSVSLVSRPRFQS